MVSSAFTQQILHFSTLHLLTIFNFPVDNAHDSTVPPKHCGPCDVPQSHPSVNTMRGGFMQSTMGNVDVERLSLASCCLFRPRQVLFATSRLTGRVPMPWMRQGSRCRRPITLISTLKFACWVGPRNWTGLSMYPSVIIVPNVLFRVRFDSIMGRALWGRYYRQAFLRHVSHDGPCMPMPWETKVILVSEADAASLMMIHGRIETPFYS
jgi:hypothetical protein